MPRSLVMLLTSLLLTACGSGATPSASQASAASGAGSATSAGAKPAGSRSLETVRFGSLTPSASDAGWLIARAKGFLAEQGIQLEVTRFSNGSELVPPLGTNQLDLGGGAPNAGLFNAVAREVQLFIVADKGSTPPGYGF